jgi:hypothetical protein
MRFLVLLLFLFSVSPAFAQDGYHSWEVVQCHEDESCLIDIQDQMVIKGLAIEDRNGLIVGIKLSSPSNISDTVYPGANFCFTGSSEKVCSLLDMMSFDEGHVEIRNFACHASDKKIELSYVAKYDMALHADVIEAVIEKCQ